MYYSIVLVDMSFVSVMTAYSVGISRHNTDNAHAEKHSGTIPVILARL